MYKHCIEKVIPSRWNSCTADTSDDRTLQSKQPGCMLRTV